MEICQVVNSYTSTLTCNRCFANCNVNVNPFISEVDFSKWSYNFVCNICINSVNQDVNIRALIKYQISNIIKKNQKSFEKSNSKIVYQKNKFDKFEKKFIFKQRVDALEKKLLGIKLKEKDKKIFEIKKELEIKAKKFNSEVESLKLYYHSLLNRKYRKVKKLFESTISEIRKNNYSKDLKKVKMDLERITVLENDFDQLKIGSKEYKEFKGLKHNLIINDKEYNKFKKKTTEFNKTLYNIYIMLAINIIIIFLLGVGYFL